MLLADGEGLALDELDLLGGVTLGSTLGSGLGFSALLDSLELLLDELDSEAAGAPPEHCLMALIHFLRSSSEEVARFRFWFLSPLSLIQNFFLSFSPSSTVIPFSEMTFPLSPFFLAYVSSWSLQLISK